MEMRVVRAATVMTLLAACAGCHAEESEPRDNGMGASQAVVKVVVSRTGAIAIDGSPVTVSELQDRFAAAARSGAVIWCYRENGGGDPPEEAMLVMDAIVEHKLAVSLSSKPDFSTVVLPDGTVRDR